MAIQSVEELHDGRGLTLSQGMERQYERRFRVRTDSKLVGPLEVVYANGIPRIGDGYTSFRTTETDPFALCRRVNPVQDANDWTCWTVTADFDTQGGSVQSIPDNPGQPGAGGGSGQSGDPSLEPPVISYDTQDRERAFTKDLGDPENDIDLDLAYPRPLLNSAGQPFDPVPTVESGWTVVTVERNEPTLNRGRLNHFRFTTNKDTWNGEQPGRWLCRPITATRVYKGGFQYYRFRYTFWLAGEDDADWDNLLLLDQGLCRKGQEGGPPQPIIVNGHPITQPALLKDGVPLTPAQIADRNIGAQFLKFKRYRRVPFAPLNIAFD